MSEMQNLVDNVNKVVYKIDEPYRRPVKTVYEDYNKFRVFFIIFIILES